MARIPLPDLYRLITSSPNYEDEWRLEVDAEQALTVPLAPGKPKPPTTSETFETAAGLILILDVDERGRVWQIELA